MDGASCIARLLLTAAVILVLASCGSGEQVDIFEIKVAPKTINVGEMATLSADTAGAVAYKWEASKGKLTNPNAASTDYVAPETPGFVTITLTVKGRDGSSQTKSVTIQVVQPVSASSGVTVEQPTPASPLADVFPQALEAEAVTFLDSPDSPGSLSDEFTDDPACRRSGLYGLRIIFDFSKGGFGGWISTWEPSPEKRYDASAFKALTFFVRGAAPQGFQIGIKDTGEREVKVEAKQFVVVSDSEWRQVSIPLSKFASGGTSVDLANVLNVNFGFNPDHGSGNICIDDIAFK